jgi:hypothetical protein
MHINLATTLSCLNINNISIEKLQVIKTFNQLLWPLIANPNAEKQM